MARPVRNRPGPRIPLNFNQENNQSSAVTGHCSSDSYQLDRRVHEAFILFSKEISLLVLWTHAGTIPRLFERFSFIPKSVVEAAWSALPELDHFRAQGVAAPEIWTGYNAFRKAFSERSIPIFKPLAVGNRRALL
jgi:hypothetical protein